MLTARWQNLVMLNFEVDPALLDRYRPTGTQMDDFEGRALVTVVGFMFRQARLWGLPAIGARCFPEVNLRCYVRRPVPGGFRRGVVFIKELVPKRIIALIARYVYGENFQHAPVRCRIDPPHAIDDIDVMRRVEYRWSDKQHPGLLTAVVGSDHVQAKPQELEFIVRRNWAYSTRRDGSTWEYYVDHPAWHILPASMASLQCNVAELCGPSFPLPLSKQPSSACLVDGSAVAVYPGQRLD